MRTKLKHIGYAIGITFACILLMLVMLLCVISDSQVQTSIVRVLTKEASRALQTEVSIKNVSYKLFNKIEIEDIYIADQQGDTLLYVNSLQAKFSFWSLLHKEIRFKNILLNHVQGNIKELENGELNIAFLFGTPKEVTTLPYIQINTIQLADANLQLLDYHIQDLETNVAINCISNDSIDAEIITLQFHEPNGLELNNLSAHLIINEQGAHMPRLRLQMPSSELDAQRVAIQFPSAPHTHLFDYLGTLSKDTNLLAEITIDLQINHAQISPSDLHYFVPALHKISNIVDFSCSLQGQLNALHASELALDYGSHEILRGNLSIYGLPNIDSTYIQANLQNLQIDYSLIEDLLSDIQNRPFTLPNGIQKLGLMRYHGFLDGQLNNIKLHGEFTTDLGNLSTDGQLHAKDNYRTLDFIGHISTDRFELGTVLENEKLGDIALQAEINGMVDSTSQLNIDVCADIPFFQFNDYTYHHAHVDGLWNKSLFSGKIRINDPHVGASFDGLIDFSQETPSMDFYLNVARFHMGEVNLSEKYAHSDLRFGMHLNAHGNFPDYINGILQIDTLYFQNNDQELSMQEMQVIAESQENAHTTLKIQSDFLNTTISGDYTYSTLLSSIQGMLLDYIPQSLNTIQQTKVEETRRENQIDYYIYLKNIEDVCEVLDLPISLAGLPTIKGFIDEKENLFSMQMVIPELHTSTLGIEDITMNMDNENDQLNLSLYLLKRARKLPGSEKMGDLTCLLQAEARDDSLWIDFDFTNDDEITNAGALYLQSSFSHYNERPLIDVEILPSEFTLNDSTWYLDNSHIIYNAADTTLQIENFRFGNEDKYILANGIGSKQETDSILLNLQGIVLDYILEYTNVADAEISFGGAITGWATIYELFNTPRFEADVEMKNAKINNGLLGDATATAQWNHERKTVDILGEVVENGDTIASVMGVVTPKQRAWDLQIEADSANLSFIEYWTKGIFNEVSGRGFGHVHVYGKDKQTWVECQALAKDACLGVDILGTKYYFSDSVYMDIDNIRFENIKAYDKEGNPVIANGIIKHDGSFTDMSYNIDISCEKALVMDLPETTQDMFYGQVYGTGRATIIGNETETRINAVARTDRKTDFYLSLSTASSAKENSFITFVQRNVTQEDDIEPTSNDKSTIKTYLDLQIEATPDANVTLLLDPKTGDQLNGRGEGNIKLSYDMAADDVKLFGNYTLNSGSFLFTFQNVIRKEFTIRDGSRVMFTGDPMAIQIDASAVYSTTASLRDLFGTDFSQVSTNRSSVPVNCLLFLKDQLMNPTLSFDIELPQSDESVESQVRSVISTEDMMMRQILYLLVFNRFYTPEYLQANTNTVGLNETYSLISSTVTGQINNWLSKMTNDFSIGFNMRADGLGIEGGGSQEYETQFQYQYNNRLLINGNLGYRYNDISNQPLFGNLDVEYILTPSGHWRAKAYTHTVDKYSLKEAQTVQGVGFMFKYDFGKKEQKAPTKQVVATDSIKVEIQDSIIINQVDSIQDVHNTIPIIPEPEQQDSIPTWKEARLEEEKEMDKTD